MTEPDKSGRNAPHNKAVSVRARLLNKARAEKLDFNLLLTRYALERVLYRLSISEQSGQFLLKGALLFDIWFDLPHRPTHDADLLGFGSTDMPYLEKLFREISQIVCNDGIVFQADSVKAVEIRKEANYAGVRVTMLGLLDGARCPVQIDIGSGDAVTPAPQSVQYPVILDGMPQPQLRVYPRTTVVAEKLEAMVKLGILNSRLKDYFDLWVLARHSDFNGAVLAQAGLGLGEVVKCNVYLVDMADFAAMNAAYREAFAAPYPARTTVGVAALPLGARVEIELVARRPPGS